ncbi:MAG: triose-phosphate isomerase [Candidatus Cloacimonetes bacterium]|nr:triose-phosphate isomerase [Candidatus Cloacimonadota bacterium]
MRNILVAGNWKMNKTPAETNEFLQILAEFTKSNQHPEVEVMVAPTYLSLSGARDAIADANILLSAQDVSKNINGAFTGEVSAFMLASLPVDMCIIGHSERRAYHQETDETINRKLQMLLASGIKPIICIGETLEQREAEETMEVVITQLEGCLNDVKLATGDEIVIAYEPVWAIGTGITATPEQAQEVHSLIRRLLSKLYSNEIAQKVLILYGGSMKPTNMDELLSCGDIDGGLIGGASLEIESFCKMIEIAIEKKRGV